MSELVVMVGLPGAGKSTKTQDYLNNGYVVHSSDAIREELFGGEFNRDDNKFIFSTMRNRTIKSLKDGYSVVYDATNLSKKARRFLISEVRKYTESITAHVIIRDYYSLYVYNMNRQFPKNVLDNYRKYFTLPNKEEGFDYIFYSFTDRQELPDEIIAEDKEFLKNAIKGRLDMSKHPFYNKIKDYDQQNVHHNLTLDDHIEEVYNTALLFKDKEVTIAALFHDIGKPYCAEQNKHGGMSYVGHENISAYLTLVFFFATNLHNELYIDLEKVINLISYHMRMHNTKTAKAKNKLMREIGRDLYPHLCELFIADLAGKR